MSTLQKSVAAVLLVLLLATGYGLWATNDAGGAPVQQKTAIVVVGKDKGVPVIDQHTLLIAQRLARYASTPEEQPLAQQAVQIADHELDLAFAATLHHLESHPPPLSPEAAKIQQRLDEVQKRLSTDTATLKQLNDQLSKASAAEKPALQDRVDLAQSQVELEQDEADEANSDLLQAGGNVHQRIQQMQQEHQAAEHAAASLPPPATSGTLSQLKGMVGETRQWLALRRKQRWLNWAREHVSASADQLAAERQQIADQLAASKALVPQFTARGGHAPPPAANPAPAPVTPAKPAATGPAGAAPPAGQALATAPPAPTTLIELTRQITAEEHRLTLRDQRISARRRLADVYSQWSAVVAIQARAALHQILLAASIVLLALLVLLFIDRWLERLLARARIDRRQMATLRSVIGVALQLIGIVLILLVLVGMPGQIGTMLGIVGAGLTVALKDFIVAFIGWFVLMGRNGMRVGDWVEIKGVSGEVVELNMFHTVLLETGNWTDAGHPTGRRVTFTNSFAIEGHYFNFSTTGQWLWDELTVVVPYGRDPHAVADAILKEVSEATAKDSRQAEDEWRRASHGGQRGGGISVQPGIAIRPDAGGVGAQIVVRYVTRASERYSLRARLYQSAVQLLAQRR
jgi:small-conductance mechanosensitive channel